MQENPSRSKVPVGLLIRAVRSSDTEALATLVNLPGFRAGTLRPPYQSIEETRRHIENGNPDAMRLVATIDEQIVGDIGMTRYRGRRNHVASIGMGVHDDFTGRGIGSALLAAIIDAADNWLNIMRLELTVYTDNEAALALYRKFGFEEEGILRAYAFRAGSCVDAYAMARIKR
ncbi:GNAT family N-acetyltransferase [Rhizobium mesoamericanum]|uniref:GCN5-related N-acetyltransferase n=1 Tax=Rhizobium mesoamericanum STM3625 TaxID=1211777 RepID=K0Q309_9HYPH|nr:GNAT family N-acetyltransferase [Rhizobium mesoamericanum]CCM76999.1 GCN5-related N-acetyltransferase [Rhizobium mesoamericanum STM3625]